MNAAAGEIRIGAELVSAPYILDADAAKAYHDGIEQPPRRRPPRGIHDDKDAARKAGFVAPIAGGEQTIAIIAQFLADNFRLRFVRGGRIEVSLTRPVLFGDTLTSHAKIVSINPNANRAELQIHVANQRGEQVLIGTAAVRMSDA
ncbi:MAG TPA: MaoC family dehydratase [Candidatus Binatus sp.]|uniref:MaoC family dehydratase n=1 Tax=Candidatus Binatus sp. TaxID=2811406 RepID=UPI002B45AF43|nr:MaoC family dehydratase [Candidatus Binatus sp.]HKN12829.1 MaoC family dehydratase [Candidatus Binatus sp.]